MELTLDQALQQGVTAHQEGNLQEAERLYQAILQVQPTHPDANHNLGVLAVSVNKANLALPLFEAALKENSNIEQFWLSYIDALIQEKQATQATKVIAEAKSLGIKGDAIESLANKLHQQTPLLKPNCADKNINKKISLKEKRKKISEKKKLKKHGKLKSVNKLVPSQSQINNLLEHYQSGHFDIAEELATSITQQFPMHQFSWKVLGAVLKETGKKVDAIKANQKAVQLDPKDHEAHNNLAVTLQDLGKFSEAEMSCKQAILLKSDYAEAHNNLGVTQQKLGKLEEAKDSYMQTILLKSDDAKAHSNLGFTLQELGRLDEAEANCRQAIALNAGYAKAHNNLGITLQDLGRFEEAKESFMQAISLNSNYAEAHSNLGVTLQELGLLKQAEDSCKQAILIKPDYAKAHNNLGGTLREQARLEDAATSYRLAIVFKPDYAEAHNNLGITLRDQGNFTEAESCFRQAIELKPDFDEASHLLASLTGDTTNTAPRDYVEKLFDGYASNFDHSLVDNLEYNMPKMIVDMIINNHQETNLGSILDLGCGTGLTGLEVKKYSSNLEGIDLSNAMLEQARKKNIYDKLIHQDIVDYLSTADLDFDLFIATDVFIYVGELSDIFRLIKARNRSGGKLVFSTEHTINDGYFLEKSGRYSHSKSYIEKLCEKFNFTLSHFETGDLRKEKNEFINGGLFLLEF